MSTKYNINDPDTTVNRKYYLKTPKHFLLLPDGDRRYAKEHNISDLESYDIARFKTIELMEVVLGEFDLDEMSIFFLRKRSFTDQNRTDDNLKSIYIALINLAEDLLNNRTELDMSKISVNTVCDPARPWMAIPEGLEGREELTETWNQLKSVLKKLQDQPRKEKQVNFLIDYSGKQEIDNALKTGRFQIENPIGLTVRVGDGMRLSDCPLYALTESHMHLIPKYYPEVTKQDVRNVLSLYYQHNS